MRTVVIVYALTACTRAPLVSPELENEEFGGCVGAYELSLDGLAGRIFVDQRGGIRDDDFDVNIYGVLSLTSGAITTPGFFGSNGYYLSGQADDECTLSGRWDQDGTRGDFLAVHLD